MSLHTGFARAPGPQASLVTTKGNTLTPARGTNGAVRYRAVVCRAPLGNSTAANLPAAVSLLANKAQGDCKLKEDFKYADENRVQYPAAAAPAAAKVAKVAAAKALTKPPKHTSAPNLLSTALFTEKKPTAHKVKRQEEQKLQADSKKAEETRLAATAVLTATTSKLPTATACQPPEVSLGLFSFEDLKAKQNMNSNFLFQHSLGRMDYDKAVVLLTSACFENFLITQNGFGNSFIIYKDADKIKCRGCRKRSEEGLVNKLLAHPQGVTMATVLTLMPELFLFPNIGNRAKDILSKAFGREGDPGLYLICKDAKDAKVVHLYYVQLTLQVDRIILTIDTVKCTLDNLMQELAARKLTRALSPEEVAL
jgi:hypothetical protein